jgi:HSP20 family molecular chaperone IbpA
MLDEASHMAVLARIREVINPAAMCVLGKPILVFEPSRIDYRTGEQVLHSWWLNEETVGDTDNTQEYVDVLDEGDHFFVLVELPGVQEEDIRVDAGGDRLSVAVDTAETRYYNEIPLPAGAAARDLSTTYRNGILQVRLGKEAV